MVNELTKSPLLWSISSVGLMAGGVIAFSYWHHHQPVASLPPAAISVAAESTSDIFIPTATMPWERALEFGWAAAVATQTATTELDWRRVGDLWLQAIAELEQVPPDAPQRAEAQTKIQQYLANFEYAEAAQAEARKLVPAIARGPSAAALKAGLTEAPLRMKFAHAEPAGGGSVTTGNSADHLARVELIGADDSLTQVKLVLPGVAGPRPMTMAQMVYTRQFVQAAVPPDFNPGAWIVDGLKQLQTSPQKPVNQTLGAYQITLGSESQTNAIVVTVSPKPSP